MEDQIRDRVREEQRRMEVEFNTMKRELEARN